MRRCAPLVAALALAAGCGGSQEEPEFEGAPVSDPGPIHVHGLGVNPADGALYVATHTGLYRVPAGQARAERVGERRQDTMGFSVIGPDRFIGSGHPDLREDLPPLLGLIESTDGGRTWRSVSLLGEADFHVLRAAGDHVYGFDASNGRLMASTDAGKTWTERPAPEPLLDLVSHPNDPEQLVAAGSVLYESRDGGREWSVVGGEPGYLAWPAPDRLFQVTGDGTVLASRDGGQSWAEVGSTGAEPAAFLATSAAELYVAQHDGTIVRSRDGGRSWSVRSRP